MASDLRSFLKEIKDETLRIKKEVDPRTQLGDLVSQCKSPVIFENIKEYPGWKICDLLVRERRHQAAAIHADVPGLLPELARRFGRGPGKTKIQKDAPVKEKIIRGGDVDLSAIPFCLHTPRDGGLYIGSGMCVVRDPETGSQNVAMHRIHIKGRNRTALNIFSPHSRAIIKKYHDRSQPCPMSVVIGHHPALEIATNYFGPHEGFSEHEIAASLLEETLDLIKCETSDILVPSRAEIVLEGEIAPNDVEDEGPFGEFHNYYASGISKKPALTITAITMRNDAIYRHLNATPYTDHQRLFALPAEARLFDQLKRKGIDCRDVYLPAWSGLFLVIIQMVAQVKEQVKEALYTALFTPVLPFTKMVMAVDEDIDIYNAEDVLYALATRVNPPVDISTLAGTIGLPYDLSLPELPGGGGLRIGGKLAIDATKPPLSQKDWRARLERISPKGWGRVKLADFL
jgi:2,5-furandicarboxylate decarboxylase 1